MVAYQEVCVTVTNEIRVQKALCQTLKRRNMPGEIYNPNPTIFSPARQPGRKLEQASQSLWLNASPETADEANDVEFIDQEEVFGMKCVHSRTTRRF